MNWILPLSILGILAIVLIIIKKPGVLKKDESKPLSMKNFSLKKTFVGDWKQFGVWILLMFLIWSYAHDTKGCRDMIENIDEICVRKIHEMTSNGYTYDLYSLNLSDNFEFINDYENTKRTGSRNQSTSPYLIP